MGHIHSKRSIFDDDMVFSKGSIGFLQNSQFELVIYEGSESTVINPLLLSIAREVQYQMVAQASTTAGRSTVGISGQALALDHANGAWVKRAGLW